MQWWVRFPQCTSDRPLRTCSGGGLLAPGQDHDENKDDYDDGGDDGDDDDGIHEIMMIITIKPRNMTQSRLQELNDDADYAVDLHDVHYHAEYDFMMKLMMLMMGMMGMMGMMVTSKMRTQ